MVDFGAMLPLDDPRWNELHGGYRMRFDPRPFIARIESKRDSDDEAWHELWENLHHQGDVGEASYAAVPHLVALRKQGKVRGWNIYALVSVIELARIKGKNPDVPEWCRNSYFEAIRQLGKSAASDVITEEDPETTRALLSVIALSKELPVHAELLLNYSEDELADFKSSLDE